MWDANYQGVWHLPNGTTLSATDSTSNGNNGTIANAQAAAGEIGGAASFNGGNASLDLGSGSGLRITGPITAEAWINVTGWPANGYPAGLLGMGYSYASGKTGWMLEAVTDNGGNHYLSWTSNNGATHGVASRDYLATGTWHHVVGTFDGATWRMYLDGAANGSSADAAVRSTPVTTWWPADCPPTDTGPSSTLTDCWMSCASQTRRAPAVGSRRNTTINPTQALSLIVGPAQTAH